MGIQLRQRRYKILLASRYLAFPYDRLPVVRTRCRQTSPFKLIPALPECRVSLLGFPSHDRRIMAKRLYCRSFRCSPPQYRVCRLDFRTKKRIKHLILAAHHAIIYYLCQTARVQPIPAGHHPFFDGPNGQTHACHPALCLSSARLLAVATRELF